MSTAVILIAAFQVYWLKTLYTEAKENLRSTADITFRETVYQLQANRFAKDTIIFTSTAGNDLFISDVVGMMRKNIVENEKNKFKPTKPLQFRIISDSLPFNQAEGDMQWKRKASLNEVPPKSITRVFVRDDFSANDDDSSDWKLFFRKMGVQFSKNDSHTVMLSKHPKKPFPPIIIQKIQQKNDAEKKAIHKQLDAVDSAAKHASATIKNVLLSTKSINDSLPVSTIDSAFKLACNNKNLFIQFQIIKDSIVPKQFKPAILSTSIVPVGFANPIGYRATLLNTTPYLVQKITPQIILSIGLLAFLIAAFVFLYRNMLEQQRIAQIKNQFISNITHELKTPIATVHVAIEALKNFNAIQDPNKTKEYLDISGTELNRLSLLVDKVLKLSMFEQKEIELKKDWIDLNAIIQEVLNCMKLQIEKHKAQIIYTTPSDALMIQADQMHITSVLYNLIDNALKYSKASPIIQIGYRDLPEKIELSIADNGIGIPAAYQDKIFEKFFRVPTADHHNVKGYGLGLSYVAHIIQQHNGKIDVISHEEKGTQFIIQLPK